MAITNYMSLDLPTVSVTLGPTYATMLNEALETLDAHDHTSGKGKKVPTAGLDINANLNFQEYKAYNLSLVQMIDQSVALTGASNALSMSTTDGDLYYVNGSGTSIQITSGGSIVAAPGATTSLDYTTTSGNLTIAYTDTTVVVAVDTTASRTITLPLAATVSEGRIYVIKCASGQSQVNPITIAASGSDTIDGAASIELASNYGSYMLIGDGSSKYYTI